MVKELNEEERKELNFYYQKIISLLRKSCKYDQNKSNLQYENTLDSVFGTIKKVTTNPDIKTYYQYLLANINVLEEYLNE